jgi:hypothetical protein
MEQSIKIKTDDLKPSLLEGLRKYFLAIDATEITISFSTPKKKSLRIETADQVRERVEKAVKNVEDGNVVSFTGDEFLQLSKLMSSIK